MLGHKLVQVLQKEFDVWTTFRNNYAEFEKTGIYHSDRVLRNVETENFEQLKRIAGEVKPDVVINAVGVIKQLPISRDVIKTLQVNSIFPHRLAQIAETVGSRLITVSTDCVFSGRTGNYSEGDVPDATDLYGKSKNLGEVSAPRCLTLRTSIIGRELQSSHSLVEWFLQNRGGAVPGFTNAVYSGFPTIVFAGIIADLIENRRNLEGLYHVSSNPINKYDLLCLLNKYYQAEIAIEPDGDFKIDRSLDSTKFRKEINFAPPEWEQMIETMARDRTPYDKFRNQLRNG